MWNFLNIVICTICKCITDSDETDIERLMPTAVQLVRPHWHLKWLRKYCITRTFLLLDPFYWLNFFTGKLFQTCWGGSGGCPGCWWSEGDRKTFAITTCKTTYYNRKLKAHHFMPVSTFITVVGILTFNGWQVMMSEVAEWKLSVLLRFFYIKPHKGKLKWNISPGWEKIKRPFRAVLPKSLGKTAEKAW